MGRIRSVVFIAFVGWFGCDGTESRTHRPPTVSTSSDTASASKSVATTIPISKFVLYAERSIQLGAHDNVIGGDVGVAIAAPLSFGPQVMLADHVIEANHAVIAPSVSLGVDAIVGEIDTWSVTSVRSQTATNSFPFDRMPRLPLAQGKTPGGLRVFVKRGETLALRPGDYGPAIIDGTLVLEQGAFSFSSIDVSGCARFTADGPVEVHVAETLNARGATDNEIAQGGCPAKIAPKDDQPPNAANLLITVAGEDPRNGQVVSLGQHVAIEALLIAPHGTLELSDHVQATGAFAAFDIRIGAHALLAFDSGFPVSAAGDVGTQQLSGYVGIQPHGTFPILGPVPGAAIISLSIGLPIRDRAALQGFINAVSNPKSSMYRHFLTPSQFTAQYGATDADYQAVSQWAQNAGFIVTRTYDNNLLLTVTSSARDAEQAFHVNLVLRQARDDGNPAVTPFVAVDREPSVDLQTHLLWVSGFTDWRVPRARSGGCTEMLPTVVPGFATGDIGQLTTPNGVNAPIGRDIRTAYLGLNTPCTPLDGTGQTVGILSLSDYVSTDPDDYQTLNTGAGLRLGQVTPVLVSDPYKHNDPEAAGDIEAVLAMAPNADIRVFVGGGGDFNAHRSDELLMAMARDPTLTVATTSWSTASSDNAAQALAELAAHGVTFFDASGDNGNVGDPQDTTDIPNQTLVGGTIIEFGDVNINQPDRPPFDYCPIDPFSNPNCYHVNEFTWNLGCEGAELITSLYGGSSASYSLLDQDISGGGIMDGNRQFCSCYPQPDCCGGVVEPDYQQSVQMLPIDQGGNGGSTMWRDYPDVSALSYTLAVVYNGTLSAAKAGTSVAAPLWAGYMALVNEFSLRNTGFDRSGFINERLYFLGLHPDICIGPRGETCFNDINDGQTNSDTPDITGFPSIQGYDLATGWGSPTCTLLEHLGSFDPTAPLNYPGIRIHVDSGHDGVNDASSVTLDIRDAAGRLLTPASLSLKGAGDKNWDAIGEAHETLFDPQGFLIDPFAISTVTLTLHENGQLFGDNWDVAGIGVELVSAGTPSACVVKLSGQDGCDAQQPSCQNNHLSDGNPGVLRLSATVSGSGQGPVVTFNVAPSAESWGGCPAWGGSQPVTMFDELEFRIDTGCDDLDSATQLEFDVLPPGSDVPLESGVLHARGSAAFVNETEWIITVPLQQPRSFGDIGSIRFRFITDTSCFLCNGDTWDVEELAVNAINSSIPWEPTCLYRSMAGAENGGAFLCRIQPEFVFGPGAASSQTFLMGGNGCP